MLASTSLSTSTSSPFLDPSNYFPTSILPHFPRPNGPLSLHPHEPPVVRRFPPISCFIGPSGALSKRVRSCIGDRSIYPTLVTDFSPCALAVEWTRTLSDSSELLSLAISLLRRTPVCCGTLFPFSPCNAALRNRTDGNLWVHGGAGLLQHLSHVRGAPEEMCTRRQSLP